MISAVEADIIARVQAGVAYLAPGSGGTVSGVADATMAMDILVVPPPAVLVEFAGEEVEAPMTIGSADQWATTSWDLFCMSQSFSAQGEGRLDQGSDKGVYSIIDDVRGCLQGYQLPSQSQRSWMRYLGAARFALDESRVVYVTRWNCRILRSGL